MCLYNSPKAVEKFLSKHRNHTQVTVYKRLRNCFREYSHDIYDYEYTKEGKLYAPYMDTIYSVGENKSDSRRKQPSKRYEDIHNGIHVYLDRQSAKDRLRSHEVVVRMTAKVEDLLGVDAYSVAVFKKVNLSRSEYERAIK